MNRGSATRCSIQRRGRRPSLATCFALGFLLLGHSAIASTREQRPARPIPEASASVALGLGRTVVFADGYPSFAHLQLHLGTGIRWRTHRGVRVGVLLQPEFRMLRWNVGPSELGVALGGAFDLEIRRSILAPTVGWWVGMGGSTVMGWDRTREAREQFLPSMDWGFRMRMTPTRRWGVGWYVQARTVIPSDEERRWHGAMLNIGLMVDFADMPGWREEAPPVEAPPAPTPVPLETLAEPSGMPQP